MTLHPASSITGRDLQVHTTLAEDGGVFLAYVSAGFVAAGSQCTYVGQATYRVWWREDGAKQGMTYPHSSAGRAQAETYYRRVVTQRKALAVRLAKLKRKPA